MKYGRDSFVLLARVTHPTHERHPLNHAPFVESRWLSAPDKRKNRNPPKPIMPASHANIWRPRAAWQLNRCACVSDASRSNLALPRPPQKGRAGSFKQQRGAARSRDRRWSPSRGARNGILWARAWPRCHLVDTTDALSTRREHTLGDAEPVQAFGGIGISSFIARRAVTSISMRMRGSASPAEIIIAAGRISPKYLRSTGQHSRNSSALGTT
jgi:hypothetical protein